MSALMPIAAVTMAPDASWAVGVAGDGTVRAWAAGVGPRDVGMLAVDAGQPVAVALSGSRLRVLWAAGGRIRLHESIEGARPRDGVFPAPARVRALALSPSGSIAVVACDDGTLRSLNPGTGQFGPTLATGAATVRAVAVASDHGPVVAASPDGVVRRHDLAAGTSELLGICPGVRRVAVTPYGDAVIAVNADGGLIRWKPSVSPRPEFLAIGAAVSALAADGTGNKVLVAVAAGQLWLHDLTGGPPVEFGGAAASPLPEFGGPAAWPLPDSPRGPPDHRKRGRVTWVRAIAAAAVCLLAAVATFTGLYLTSRGPSRVAKPATHAATTHPATATPSTTRPALAPGVAPLLQLLPQDIDDPATQCTTMTPPFQWRMPGLVQALSCADPGLPKGRVYAFQMDSRARFQTAFQNFDTWWGITRPGPNCPPAAGRAGITGFRNDFFPLRPGQVLECKTHDTRPVYAWTLPAQDAFLMAQGAPGSSFAALDTWWVNNSVPLTSPKPSP